MSDIATKLTYLDTTREKILTETNRLGVGLTEQDKFRDYAKGLHNGYIDIINNGTDTLYNNMPKVIGIGSSITLNNTENAPMVSEMQGDTYQFTTTGKNLLNISDITDTTGITNNDNISITLNGNFPSMSYTLSESMILYSNVTYCLSINNTFTGAGSSMFILRNGSTNIMSVNFNGNPQQIVLTPTENIVVDTLRIYNSGNAFDNFTFSVQLEKNVTPTSFEPYTGEQASPNPDFPQNIEVVTGRQEVDVVGKNLFDKNNTDVKNWLIVNSTYVIQSSSNEKSVIVKVQPNTTYTISKILTNRFRVGEYSTIPDLGDTLNNYVRVGNDAGTSITITTLSTTNYLVINIVNISNTAYNLQSTLDSIQIEKGSQVTEYEEHKGQSYTIDLGTTELCKIGDYQDRIYKLLEDNKNLFNKNDFNLLNDVQFSTTTTIISTSSLGVKLLYISIEGGKTYTITKRIGSIFRVGTTIETPALNVNVYDIVVDSNVNSITINTTENTKYLVVCYYSNNDTLTEQEILDSIMINEGSTLPYEPYGTAGTWFIEKQTGYIVLNGSETEWKSDNAGKLHGLPISDILDNRATSVVINSYCNYFTKGSLTSSRAYTNQFSIYGGSVWFNDQDETLVNFKTWVSNNNLVVIYPLATTTFIEITDTELITQLNEWYNTKSIEGTTNISVTSDDLPAILNVSALKKYE